ncbi:transposase [Mesorhizobium sp. M0924]|uniref:transposase n=1 Tax=unclassified Mesorhizobium TaxID=325217 RepID=UPI0033353EDC
MGGQIVDATIVAAPKQHNTDAEKADIKAGKIPDAWKEKPAKVRQKDWDARWWPKMETRSSTTLPFPPSAASTTPASMAGTASSAAGTSPVPRPMTGRSFPMVWADTAYHSKKNEAWLEKNGYVSDIHRKKPKGRPMSEATSRANGRRSRIRAFVEHVFAQQKSRMGLFVRTTWRGPRPRSACQPRLQSHPLRLAPGAHCAGMMPKAVNAAATAPRSDPSIQNHRPKDQALGGVGLCPTSSRT